MTTQVMDPAASQRHHWNGASYMMGSRSQGSMPSNPRMTTSSLAPSTYVAADSIPSFSNPFTLPSRASADLYMDTTGFDAQSGPESARTSLSSASSSQLQYHSPVTTGAAASPAVTQQMYDQSLLAPGLLSTTDIPFTTAPSPVNPTFSHPSFDITAGPFMGPMGARSYGMEVGGRRSSQPSINVPLPASHDMLGMDQDTPRGPYAPVHRGRGSADSYNFPPAHSSTSSISSSVGSGFSHYSMDGSAVSDYSDVDTMGPTAIMRTSQGPSMLGGSSVPAQASMMTQFSSKVSSSVQKKHVCKICEKRFTRPSSLQTHVYSHTGEKPYQCTHPGCGRCFSVVSNLRRHQKIHRNRDQSADTESRSEAESPASHITDDE